MMTHVVVAEAVTSATAEEFIKEAKSVLYEIADLAGFHSFSIELEEGGNMILVTTKWNDREAMLRFHSSREYRRLIGRTDHWLVGGVIVKLFQDRSDVTWKKLAVKGETA